MIVKEKIDAFLHENLPHYLAFLKQLVDVNSFTHNLDGVRQVAKLTEARFSEIGFVSRYIPSPVPNTGEHLFLTRKGTGQKTIALITHLDTVFTAEEEKQNNFHWRVEGDRIYGPGTIDIKGGTMMIYIVLSTLQKFAPEIFNAVTWVVCCDSCEEILSADFGQTCLAELPSETWAALVFESTEISDGSHWILTGRKGRETFRISVEGRSAHAGHSHDRGINAIVELSRIVTSLSAATNYEKDFTVNIGVISGGSVTNRVPHFATADLEIRSYDASAFPKFRELLADIASKPHVTSVRDGTPSTITVECLSSLPAWPENEQSKKLAAVWQETGKELGLTVTTKRRGGLSDGNFLWHKIPTIDALGPTGGGDHCAEHDPAHGKTQEYVSVSSIIPTALLNFHAIVRLARAT